MAAKKIIHDGVKLPGPSRSLITGMGRAAYLAMASGMFLKFSSEYTDWEDLKPQYQEIWEQVARSVYAVIAIEGGAKVEEIGNAEDSGEDESKPG